MSRDCNLLFYEMRRPRKRRSWSTPIMVAFAGVVGGVIAVMWVMG